MTLSKKKAWELLREKVVPKLNHMRLYEKFVMLLEKPPEQRAYCHTCSSLLLSSETAETHDGHDITVGISEHLLTHPSEVMRASDLHESMYIHIYIHSMDP